MLDENPLRVVTDKRRAGSDRQGLQHLPHCVHDVRVPAVAAECNGRKMLMRTRERLIPDQMTGSINATYEEGLSEVSGIL